MNKRKEFIEAFIQIVKQTPEHYYLTAKWLPFADILNGNPKLRKLFRQAVAEAEKEVPDPAQGLHLLFSPRE